MVSRDYIFSYAKYVVSLFGSLGQSLEHPFTMAEFREMLALRPPPFAPIPEPIFNFLINLFSQERGIAEKTDIHSFRFSTFKFARAIAENLLKEYTVSCVCQF